MENLKKCTKCNEEKELSSFYKHKGNKDKLQYQCIICSTKKSTKIAQIIPIDGEIWRPVVGYEGLYDISNFGRIKSLAREKYSPFGNFQSQEFIIKTLVNKYGYVKATILKDGNPKYVLVHRLVAIAFLKQIEGKVHVNHINHIRSDNKLENLEWVSCRENTSYRHLSTVTTGAYQDKRLKNSWKSVIQINKKSVYLGSFKTESEASIAYKAALIHYNIGNKYA